MLGKRERERGEEMEEEEKKQNARSMAAVNMFSLFIDQFRLCNIDNYHELRLL